MLKNINWASTETLNLTDSPMSVRTLRASTPSTLHHTLPSVWPSGKAWVRPLPQPACPCSHTFTPVLYGCLMAVPGSSACMTLQKHIHAQDLGRGFRALWAEMRNLARGLEGTTCIPWVWSSPFCSAGGECARTPTSLGTSKIAPVLREALLSLLMNPPTTCFPLTDRVPRWIFWPLRSISFQFC